VEVDFTCPFASGDSGVLFIKKTPFYSFSLHSHIKRTVPSHSGRRQALVGAVPGILRSLRSLA
jgi:hypothetical protein